jgi:nucleoside-diphosphate kinase
LTNKNDVQKTFVMIKPDGVKKNLTNEIMARLERKGLEIEKIKKIKITKTLAEKHYAEHVGKPFYPGLIDFITSGPVVAMVVSGKDVVPRVRDLIGATDISKAKPGTIRHDFGTSTQQNVMHASDSPESAVREIGNFF